MKIDYTVENQRFEQVYFAGQQTMCSEDIALPHSKSRNRQNRLLLIMWGCQSDKAILQQEVISAYNNANSLGQFKALFVLRQSLRSILRKTNNALNCR